MAFWLHIGHASICGVSADNPSPYAVGLYDELSLASYRNKVKSARESFRKDLAAVNAFLIPVAYSVKAAMHRSELLLKPTPSILAEQTCMRMTLRQTEFGLASADDALKQITSQYDCYGAVHNPSNERGDVNFVHFESTCGCNCDCKSKSKHDGVDVDMGAKRVTQDEAVAKASAALRKSKP
ncbi:Hypothetical Protein FCC1311_058212 [Hondaea fermentalgiana]|uniref:Uncharacterized protein n=1 Tax=Hondaea fermentalgiana TaxID=2315210 RepID=A0A2R5GF96_9STRA|nr:Hypothetical Protein FCC1311_058212 [Hondaea fermentalgiana]|eukprot:GBG29600.1 Hypothetical Protein FCC1311_058212 [Hondaea fermentalgiana]